MSTPMPGEIEFFGIIGLSSYICPLVSNPFEDRIVLVIWLRVGQGGGTGLFLKSTAPPHRERRQLVSLRGGRGGGGLPRAPLGPAEMGGGNRYCGLFKAPGGGVVQLIVMTTKGATGD